MSTKKPTAPTAPTAPKNVVLKPETAIPEPVIKPEIELADNVKTVIAINKNGERLEMTVDHYKANHTELELIDA